MAHPDPLYQAVGRYVAARESRPRDFGLHVRLYREVAKIAKSQGAVLPDEPPPANPPAPSRAPDMPRQFRRYWDDDKE